MLNAPIPFLLFKFQGACIKQHFLQKPLSGLALVKVVFPSCDTQSRLYLRPGKTGRYFESYITDKADIRSLVPTLHIAAKST